MSTKYYWKECFGICLEGSAAKHWFIRNDDDCESVIAEVCQSWAGDRNRGLWRGYAFHNATKECETLTEAQRLTVNLVKKISKNMSNLKVGKE